MEWHKDRNQSARIKASLVAEIAGLVEITEYRGYLKDLQKVCNSLKSASEGTTDLYRVQVPKHYSRIYQANSDRIGALDADTARKMVVFHQLIDAVVQDVVPGGALYEGADLEAFMETTDILERALQLGKEIVNDTKQVTGAKATSRRS
jgi:hypothetical protein